MVLSLSMRVPGSLLVHSLSEFSLKLCSDRPEYGCIHAAYGTVTLYESSWWPVGTQSELCTDRPPGTLIETDSTICCMYTIVSS